MVEVPFSRFSDLSRALAATPEPGPIFVHACVRARGRAGGWAGGREQERARVRLFAPRSALLELHGRGLGSLLTPGLFDDLPQLICHN